MCLPPHREEVSDHLVILKTDGVACADCVRGLVAAWAKEAKRKRDFPPNGPTPPNSPPSGDAEPAELTAVAA